MPMQYGNVVALRNRVQTSLDELILYQTGSVIKPDKLNKVEASVSSAMDMMGRQNLLIGGVSVKRLLKQALVSTKELNAALERGRVREKEQVNILGAVYENLDKALGLISIRADAIVETLDREEVESDDSPKTLESFADLEAVFNRKKDIAQQNEVRENAAVNAATSSVDLEFLIRKYAQYRNRIPKRIKDSKLGFEPVKLPVLLLPRRSNLRNAFSDVEYDYFPPGIILPDQMMVGIKRSMNDQQVDEIIERALPLLEDRIGVKYHAIHKAVDPIVHGGIKFHWLPQLKVLELLENHRSGIAKIDFPFKYQPDTNKVADKGNEDIKERLAKENPDLMRKIDNTEYELTDTLRSLMFFDDDGDLMDKRFIQDFRRKNNLIKHPLPDQSDYEILTEVKRTLQKRKKKYDDEYKSKLLRLARKIKQERAK